MNIIKCGNCNKKIRSNNSVTLLSGSISGHSCITYLCPICASNPRIVRKMQKINDIKLDLMDGVKFEKL